MKPFLSIFTYPVTTMNEPHKPSKRRRLGSWKAPTHCLGCDEEGTFSVQMRPSHQLIQGKKIPYETEKYYCEACEAEWLSPSQAGESARKGVMLFQKKYGMLTASDLRDRRKTALLTQDELAERSQVSAATIKRLEGGVHIVHKVSNQAIESALADAETRKEDMELDPWELILDDLTVSCGALAWGMSQALSGDDVSWELPMQDEASLDDDAGQKAADSNELALAA
jgi:transcriptional regulator with XRE-family HTH domain